MDCASGIDLKSAAIKEVGDHSAKRPSPYSDFVTLNLADEVLYIHRFLLQKLPKLRAAAFEMNALDMPDVSGETGHVIVHYLYTEKYDGVESSFGSDALRRSFEVYAAATKYQIPDLREKAQEAIEANTDDLNAAEALAALKHACPLPDPRDVWLHEYTKTLVNAAYADVSSFLASDIMAPENAESTMSITEMILRAVIRSAKERELSLAEVEKANQDVFNAELAEVNQLEAKKESRGGKLLKKDQARLSELIERLEVSSQTVNG